MLFSSLSFAMATVAPAVVSGSWLSGSAAGRFTSWRRRFAMIEFRPLTYETLEVGEEFVSDEHLVTPEDIETYAFAVDDHHPWFFEDSPFGGPIAHPTLLGNQALRLRHGRYIVHAGLHAKMEFEFLEPIRQGVRVRSRGTVVDKYERRGKPYMVTEFVTEDEKGTALVRGRFTQMLFRDGGAL
jgi:acyl dehydratase